MRRRFGMTAPRVMVRAQIPWYWRTLTILLTFTIAVLVAVWVYDLSRRFVGDDKNHAEQELSALRDRIRLLELDVEHNHSNGSGSEASLQIERTAQQQLGEQVRRLEIENGRLREDLAAFENLASGDAKSDTVTITRLQVDADGSVAGVYRYRMLVSAPASRSEFKGRLQLIATILQDGKTAMVNIPDGLTSGDQRFAIAFKYFRRIEGSFFLPSQAVLKKLEVRLMQGTTVMTSQQLAI